MEIRKLIEMNGVERISLEETISIFKSCRKPIEDTVEISLLDTVGMVVSEDIIVPMDNPPFNRSPLDGYTFSSADTTNASDTAPAIFELIGEECAGDFLRVK